jgi:hypothetical protein
MAGTVREQVLATKDRIATRPEGPLKSEDGFGNCGLAASGIRQRTIREQFIRHAPGSRGAPRNHLRRPRSGEPGDLTPSITAIAR